MILILEYESYVNLYFGVVVYLIGVFKEVRFSAYHNLGWLLVRDVRRFVVYLMYTTGLVMVTERIGSVIHMV